MSTLKVNQITDLNDAEKFNITSGTAVASTSGTSIDFTGFPSWVKRITVIFNEVSLNGSDHILIQLGDSGGFETTGYVSSSTATTGGAGGTFISTSGLIVVGSSATYLNSGSAVITHLGSNLWVQSGAGKLLTSACWISGGSKTLSDTLTQIRITTSGTNTFDAGSINILYEA